MREPKSLVLPLHHRVELRPTARTVAAVADADRQGGRKDETNLSFTTALPCTAATAHPTHFTRILQEEWSRPKSRHSPAAEHRRAKRRLRAACRGNRLRQMPPVPSGNGSRYIGACSCDVFPWFCARAANVPSGFGISRKNRPRGKLVRMDVGRLVRARRNRCTLRLPQPSD